jgi:site-specific recombinase
VRDKFLGKEEKRILCSLCFPIFSKNKLVGIDITQSTFNKYSLTYRRLQEFLIETMNRKDIPIRNVNHDFVYQFRIYLKADKKLSINSSEKLMRIFKRITTFAFKTELILCNPFAFYTKRTGGLTEGVR